MSDDPDLPLLVWPPPLPLPLPLLARDRLLGVREEEEEVAAAAAAEDEVEEEAAEAALALASPLLAPPLPPSWRPSPPLASLLASLLLLPPLPAAALSSVGSSCRQVGHVLRSATHGRMLVPVSVSASVSMSVLPSSKRCSALSDDGAHARRARWARATGVSGKDKQVRSEAHAEW